MKWYEAALMSGKKLPGILENWAIIKSLRSPDRTPALVALYRKVNKKPKTEQEERQNNSD